MAYPYRKAATTLPYQGSFVVSSSVADLSPTYPDDGYGAKTTTSGDALWKDLGLVDGTFEIEVTKIICTSGANAVTLLERAASGTSQIHPAGTHTFSAGCGPIFRDGFSFNTSAGGAIHFKIHVYHDFTPE